MDKLNNQQRLKRHLLCNDEVYNLIVNDCVEEYVRNHPEMEGAKISQNHILKQLARYYLKY